MAGCEQEGQEEAGMGTRWGPEAWTGHSWQPGEVQAGREWHYWQLE